MKKNLFIIALFAAVATSAQTPLATKSLSYPSNYNPSSLPLIEEGLIKVTSLPNYGLAGSYSISGELNNNLAGEVKSATIHYIVDNGNTITQSLVPNASSRGIITDYKFQSDINLSVGNHTIKVWISEINGVAQTNKNVVSTDVHIASRAAKRHGLVEQFTSSTCPPCASENKLLDPLLVKNNVNTGGDLNVIKYQMHFPAPGDPSLNAHATSRYKYYGISGIPDGRVNGAKKSFTSQSDLDASKTVPATVDIEATLVVNGKDIKASATITPYVSQDVKVHQALVQYYYEYNGSAGQKKYYFAMRKMNPDGNGESATIADGTPLDVKFDYTATDVAKPQQGSFDFWTITPLEYQYVVYVQDNKTKAILNSASAKKTVTGIVSFKGESKIGVYPNPAQGYAIIGIQLVKESNLTLTIYDIAGKVAYHNESPQAGIGQNEININTTNFAKGIYTIVVNTNDGLLREKLIVN